jgi:hypothetical protein
MQAFHVRIFVVSFRKRFVVNYFKEMVQIKEIHEYSDSPTYRYHFNAGIRFLKNRMLESLKDGKTIDEIKTLLDEVSWEDELVLRNPDKKNRTIIS